jgi:hypothetical protein
VDTEEITAEEAHTLNPSDIKLMFKGRVLSDYTTPLFHILSPPSTNSKKTPKVIRLMAMGQSNTEIQQDHLRSQQALTSHHHTLIRDDLTKEGLKQLVHNRNLGRNILAKRQSQQQRSSPQKYGFQTIQTLPNLPNESQAREILHSLSQDPGILACMAHHQWKVPLLSEMYPEGKVGESEVCILGLNRNQGGEILLRLRTDDLQGFRKIQTIRKVLFHELAHNVHSEHDGDFFLLMRQIEKECVEMNWTMSTDGHTLNGNTSHVQTRRMDGIEDEYNEPASFQGGVYRLGGNNGEEGGSHVTSIDVDEVSSRERRAQAAMNRLQLVDEDSNKSGKQQGLFCSICKCNHFSSSTNHDNCKHN